MCMSLYTHAQNTLTTDKANQPLIKLTLFVSDAQAQFVASAIDRFLKEQHLARNKNVAIQARSASQVLSMPPQNLQRLIQQSDFIIGGGLYGPAVTVLSQFSNHNNQLFFNSDHQLVYLSRYKQERIFPDLQTVSALSKQRPTESFTQWLKQQLQQNTRQQHWVMARSYWQAGGTDNIAKLLQWQVNQVVGDTTLPPQLWPEAQASVRWIQQNQIKDTLNQSDLKTKDTIVILDSNRGDRISDREVSKAICKNVQASNLNCVVALSRWGQPAVDALQQLLPYKKHIKGFVFLQDFVVGGGEGREAANGLFAQFNVPILKAIKSYDRTWQERQVSVDGIAAEKIYYQVAMPELQGASQPLVVASKDKKQIHKSSGLELVGLQIDQKAVNLVSQRLSKWHALNSKSNKDKKLAIVYYNHPPGRHNIGADNLDVPASLWHILNQLKDSGYNVGQLPESQDALLDMLQAKGVNLPNQPTALEKMAKQIHSMSVDDYQQYFNTLPASIQQELTKGPMGYMHAQIKAGVLYGHMELAHEQLEHGMEEIHHLLEGLDHPARNRAEALLEKLESAYAETFESHVKHAEKDWAKAESIIKAIMATGIEGLRGWGEAPGQVMVWNNELLLPGIQFGNVFIGPQPPRGWEINEELLHANLAFPPPHQYLAFYHFLRDQFSADAIIHLGRHSTYEFLPRRSVGLLEDDYSRIIAADIPGIYPYIVDGVGEGIQAKRRGLAVMVDHLTPPLKSTELYDELLQLRQLIESFEANHESDQTALKTTLVKKIRDKVDSLELKEELEEFMSAELAVMGIGFDQVDDDMLIHEIGHYLTEMQERFMPLGLHIFAKDWQPNAVDMMLDSMAPETETQRQDWQSKLTASPKAEMESLLNALNGGLVEPGMGNDPIRTSESLPTGRNFYALDSSLIPSPTAWELGAKMAEDARKNNPQSADKSEAIVLWASDVVRDEGVMIAFGLNMMGVKPVWNSRGLVKNLEPISITNDDVRRNTVFTSSGLFRDLYAKQMLLINKAVLYALAQSGKTIQQDYPVLTIALASALEHLPEVKMGNEPLKQNQVAAHWLEQAQSLLADNHESAAAGKLASLRVFGTSSYGAGINRMVERSGAWENREQVAQVYLKRMGHSYGLDDFGASAQKILKQNLAKVENSYLGRSSNLYGLMDNNDAFDYFGGLSLAIETLTGDDPNSYVIHHANLDNIVTQPLNTALKQELRGRFLNPEWLTGLMAHDYAGARTMGSEFLEYLWGWQVTNPDMIDDWMWEDIKSVYMDDKYNIQLDEFLENGHNVHVKANMLAIMLVAIHKEFWQTKPETTQALATKFADLVAENGLPGSGHTSPNHPMLPWLEQHISAEQWQKLAEVIQADQALLKEQQVQKAAQQEPTFHTVTEIQLDSEASTLESHTEIANTEATNEAQEANQLATGRNLVWLILVILLSIFVAGFLRQQRQFKQLTAEE